VNPALPKTSVAKLQSIIERIVPTVVPILLGGWFLFVAITSFAALPSRSVALPEAGRPELLLDDFVVFYTAGKHVPEVGAAIYAPSAMSALEANETGQNGRPVVTLPFFNPPSALLPFSVLGLLPLWLAAGVWLIASGLLAVAAIRLLTPHLALSSEATLLLILGIVASLPLYQTLVHGQMTFALLAGFCLYSVGVLRKDSARDVVAGLLLLALKPVFLPLPLLFLALQRRYRVLLAFAGFEGLLILLAAVLFGPRLPLDYIGMSLKAFGWDEVNGISTYGMFGWTGFWRGVLGPDSHELQMMLTMVSTVATIAAFTWVFRRGDKPHLALAALVPAALLISPHSYSQDLLLLTMPVLLLMNESRATRTPALFAVGIWFAAYVHFDVLASTGVGVSSVALALVTGFLLIRAMEVRLPVRIVRPAPVHTTQALDVGLSTADAAGS
jgi:Glycosyltransferase family 87